MASKSINSRIQLKNDTEAHWSLAQSFTPLKGEAIIYNPDDDNAVPRLKIGDGETNVNSLPFVGVTGVKGNEETEYRTGSVNLTPENIGAAPIDSPAFTGVPTVPDLQLFDPESEYESLNGYQIVNLSYLNTRLAQEYTTLAGRYTTFTIFKSSWKYYETSSTYTVTVPTTIRLSYYPNLFLHQIIRGYDNLQSDLTITDNYNDGSSSTYLYFTFTTETKPIGDVAVLIYVPPKYTFEG